MVYTSKNNYGQKDESLKALQGTQNVQVQVTFDFEKFAIGIFNWWKVWTYKSSGCSIYNSFLFLVELIQAIICTLTVTDVEMTTKLGRPVVFSNLL